EDDVIRFGEGAAPVVREALAGREVLERVALPLRLETRRVELGHAGTILPPPNSGRTASRAPPRRPMDRAGPTTQASWPCGRDVTSPGPAMNSAPSSMRIARRPLTWYRKCNAPRLAVPAIGLTS